MLKGLKDGIFSEIKIACNLNCKANLGISTVRLNYQILLVLSQLGCQSF